MNISKIKETWAEGETLHAADVNDMANAINALIDAQSTPINDDEQSSNTAYSSNKTVSVIEKAKEDFVVEGEPGDDTVYSSWMINKLVRDTRFKTVVVDSLPEVGKKNTMYLKQKMFTHTLFSAPIIIPTPDGSISAIFELSPTSPVRFYKYHRGMPTMDTEWIREMRGGFMPSIGDVIKYVAGPQGEDGTEQTCWATNFSRLSQLQIGARILTGTYEVGDTFLVGTPMAGNMDRAVILNDPNLITGYTTISIDGQNITGRAIGRIRVNQGSVYRMTGYYEIAPESILNNSELKNKYHVYVATFVLANDVAQADHTVGSLGSIFTVGKQDTREFVVPSSINENALTFSQMKADTVEELTTITNGIQTMTLQDGHYYRVKGVYELKMKNIAQSMLKACMHGLNTGADVLIYEEVYDPSVYVESDIVPLANIYNGIGYRDSLFLSIYGTVSEEPDMAPDMAEEMIRQAGSVKHYQGTCYRNRCVDFPEDSKEGDCFIITGENTGITISSVSLTGFHPFGCAVNVINPPNFFNSNTITGITECLQWEKGECYRFTGYQECSGVSYFGEKYMVPTFEKVNGTVPRSKCRNIEGLPLLCMRIEGEKKLYDKWVWLNDKWEYFGNKPDDNKRSNNNNILA